MLLEDSLKNYDDSLYQISISTFLVELNLDVVLKVLQVVDLNFFLIKLVDKYQRINNRINKTNKTKLP